MADQDKTNPARNYPKDDPDNAGGITNRPLSEEVENQESLPDRGRQKDSPRDGGAGPDDVLNRNAQERYDTPRRYDEGEARPE